MGLLGRLLGIAESLTGVNLVVHPEIALIYGAFLFYVCWFLVFLFTPRRYKPLHVLVWAYFLHLDHDCLNWGDYFDNERNVSIQRPSPTQIDLMTFNIRAAGLDTNTPQDWLPYRRPLVGQVINFQKPAVVGTQEASEAQLDHILRDTGYSMVPCSDHLYSCDSAIIFDSDQVKLTSHDMVWLSPTPTVENTYFEGARVRTATRATFQYVVPDRGSESEMGESNATIVVTNTHLETHETGRRQQAAVLGHFASQNHNSGDHVFVMGDMNAIPYGPTSSILEDFGFSLDPGYDVLPKGPRGDPGLSFHGWMPGCVDNMFVRIPLRILSTVVSAISSTSMAVWLPEYLHIDWIMVHNTSRGQPVVMRVMGSELPPHPSDHHPVMWRYSLST